MAESGGMDADEEFLVSGRVQVDLFDGEWPGVRVGLRQLHLTKDGGADLHLLELLPEGGHLAFERRQAAGEAGDLLFELGHPVAR